MLNDPYHQGAWLKRKVAQSGRSTAEFARQIGVARETLQRWYKETPLRGMRPHLLWKVIDLLNLTSKVEEWGNVRESEDRVRPQTDYRGIMMDASTVEHIISDIMRDERLPGTVDYRMETLQKVARGEPSNWHENIDMASMHSVAPIPTFDLAVAAGQWVEVGGEGVAPDLATFDRGVFRVRIAGDSMEKKYPNGCTVEFALVQPDREGVVPGKNYYWHRSDGFATFKKLEKIEDETLVLRAINRKKYPKPLAIAKQEVVRVARARGMFIPDE